MRQLLAAWMVVNEQDLPMNPRLLGKPGVGKTTLAYAAARRMGRDTYILAQLAGPQVQKEVAEPDDIPS